MCCKCGGDVPLEINNWNSWQSRMNRVLSGSHVAAVPGNGWRKDIGAQSLTLKPLFFQGVGLCT